MLQPSVGLQITVLIGQDEHILVSVVTIDYKLFDVTSICQLSFHVFRLEAFEIRR